MRTGRYGCADACAARQPTHVPRAGARVRARRVAGGRRHRAIRDGRRGQRRRRDPARIVRPARRSQGGRRRGLPPRLGDQADGGDRDPARGRGRPVRPHRADRRLAPGPRPSRAAAVLHVARAHAHHRPRRRRRRGGAGAWRRPRRAAAPGAGHAPGDAARIRLPIRVDDLRPPRGGARQPAWPVARRAAPRERPRPAGHARDDVRSRARRGRPAGAGPGRPAQARRRAGPMRCSPGTPGCTWRVAACGAAPRTSCASGARSCVAASSTACGSCRRRSWT